MRAVFGGSASGKWEMEKLFISASAGCTRKLNKKKKKRKGFSIV